MRLVKRLLVLPLGFLMALSTSAFADQQHAIDPSALASAVSQHVAKQDSDRAALREALARPEVRAVAGKLGVDLDRAAAAVDTMSGLRSGARGRPGPAGESIARRRRIDGSHLDDDDYHRAAGAHRHHPGGEINRTSGARLDIANRRAVARRVSGRLDRRAVPAAVGSALRRRGGCDGVQVLGRCARGRPAVRAARRRAGRRIANDELVGAVTARGWRATPLAGSLDLLHEQLEARRPLIILLEDRPRPLSLRGRHRRRMTAM